MRYKGKRQIGRVLTTIVIAGLGTYVIFGGSSRIVGEAKKEVCRLVQEKMEQTYVSGLAYMKEDRKDPEDWLMAQAMRMMPIGAYIEERTKQEPEVEDRFTYERILAKQAKDENEVDENGKLIHGDGSQAAKEASQPVVPQIDMGMEKLRDFNYLLNNFYIVDSTTEIFAEELQAEELLAKEMKIDRSKEGPKVLIYHTHSQEAFADSVPGDTNTTIVGMGRYLAQLLNEQYGIETIHHEGVYDLIDGKLDRSKAYDLAKPALKQILKENPSIEVVIDLHRDGVREDTRLVTEIDGKPTAKIMFFNGLSRTKSNGNVNVLQNPYKQENLAFSLQMKLACEKAYPGFTRKIYLKGYRYNMNYMPKSLLVEGGAQTNTVEEMRNAMVILAEMLNEVLVGDTEK